jgi:hypothetical protein
MAKPLTSSAQPQRPSSPQELRNPLDFVRLGLEAAKGGVPDVLIWAGGSILAVAAVMIPTLIAARKAELAAGTFLVATLAVLWLSWLAAKNPANFQVQRQWRVVQQPLRGDKLDQLDKELSAVHKLAADAFAKIKSDPAVKDKVRANIFLADYRRAPEGVGCELRMPAPFRRRMHEAGEWDLAFQPGWGATGEVFRSAQPVLTTDRLYGIPDSLQSVFDQLIAADLKAIISMPILDDKNPNVVAVLNVDVCERDVEPKDLTAVYGEIKGSTGFKNLYNLINQLDKAWLTIGLRTG